MKKLLFTIALLCAAISANAQISVLAGYQNGVTNVKSSLGSLGITDRYIYNGAIVGVTYDEYVGGNYGLRSGLYADYSTSKYEDEGVSHKDASANLSIPIMAFYEFKINDVLTLGAAAGPEYSYNIVNQGSTIVSSVSVKSNFRDSGDYSKSLFYVLGEVYLRIYGHFNINFGGFIGLTDFAKSGSVTMRSNGMNLTLGYRF